MEIALPQNPAQWCGLALAVTAASLGLTALLRRYALRRHLLDIPNARSSHTAPTPRGGGAAIVASLFAALAVAGYMDMLPAALVWTLMGAGGLVALAGLIDDHGHLAVRWRLLAHFIAAAACLHALPKHPGLFGAAPPPSGSALAFLVCGEALYLVWMLNLYNFMDGIDGLAGTEAICAGLGGALLFLSGGAPDLAAAPFLLAAAAAGFLYWNWPPARIFMGDAGSGFLGFAFGVLSLHAALHAPALFWGWMILLAVFICDASLTLARRAFAGARIHEAHRSHAYQHAARRWGHRSVTLAVAAINIFWLLPLALAAVPGHVPPTIALAAAYAPLLALAWTLDAGKDEGAHAHKQPPSPSV
ncbi:MAG: glycosyltransferase family 4 protein [Azoarcus sp.]|jgi:Fuc2NAc and GlcNAc transferase|nr:glycosyltransferase family 4 protein [Azoarcus sp.]